MKKWFLRLETEEKLLIVLFAIGVVMAIIDLIF